ncbi:cap-specific mRNA (nucleoside-2'-O-)-methyltransferase 2-like [Adelges cooleyi]|uniref:cap-specific mRNA (nucleoside-2'-O-)-methyltransferase 2-like n=1 Tax=Adelges cooleyi TaxID=133065 RepID=UPI00218047BA|nr:cap-specific mRNA (nucleoside-2'-O-)-methyltransferase 2-like [Adelges cooleyi]
MSTFRKHTQNEEFSKMFAFSTEWHLPDIKYMFIECLWQIEKLQDQKNKLNLVKHKLNEFELDKWHEHTAKMNPAGLVMNHVRKHIHPDFLTQAWCKFYEILCSSSLFHQDALLKGNIFTVHLCEAPGAFVSALNHFMALNYNSVRFDWLAMTLNPYHESNGHPHIVSDDRLILNTMENWEFGPDYTGDIFQSRYHEHLYETVLEKFGGDVSLVTADGSIDCSNDPGEQENIVMRLHNYEMMVALNILQDRGSLVLKMFTMFECNTICRMYLLCCLFESVVVRKPATSKSGNSEVYAVCTGYKGKSMALPFIRTFFTNDHKNAMFPLNQIPCDFIDELYKCSKYFTGLQITTIENNIKSWNRKDDGYCEMNAVQWLTCQEFITRYKLKAIRWDQELISSGNWSKVITKSKKISLSYAEKIRRRNLNLREEAALLYQEIISRDDWSRGRCKDILWGRRDQISLNISDVRFRMGKPVTEVRGSKFCNELLLQHRYKITTTFPWVSNENNTESRSLYFKTKLNYYQSKLTICDLTDICTENRNDNVVQQFKCLNVIIDTLRQTSGDLLLIGYPLYTQMAVACFFAIASMFEMFGIMKPDNQFGHAFIFLTFRNHTKWLDMLIKATDHVLPNNGSGLALVSWLPIKLLLKQKAYPDIVALNNVCIINEVEPILSSYVKTEF